MNEHARAGQRHPLIRSTARASVVAGLAVGATGLLGGTAGAEDTVVVHDPVSSVHAQAGQRVALAPSALDAKLRSAVLLARPLDPDAPAEASKEFDEQAPIPLGTATEGRNSYSGSEIADAAESRLSRLGLPEESTDAVAFHFRNLVTLGSSVTVRGEAPPPPPPKEPEPAPAPKHPPKHAEPAPPARTPDGPEPGASAPTGSEPGSSGGSQSAEQLATKAATTRPAAALPAQVQVLPPEHATVPGPFTTLQAPAPAAPPQAQPAQPGQPNQQQVREEVRAAGKAESMPIDISDRVALPVIFAAISVAGVTAALVRSWILHRG